MEEVDKKVGEVEKSKTCEGVDTKGERLAEQEAS